MGPKKAGPSLSEASADRATRRSEARSGSLQMTCMQKITFGTLPGQRPPQSRWLAGGYLVMSGTTAEPAAGESSSETGKSETGSTSPQAVRVRRQRRCPGAGRRRGRQGRQDDATSESSQVPQNKTWIESLRSRSESDAKDDAQEQVDNEDGKDGKSTAAAKAATSRQGRQRPRSFPTRSAVRNELRCRGQVDIYGAKRAVEPPRPLLELGRQQYTSGTIRREQHPPG